MAGPTAVSAAIEIPVRAGLSGRLLPGLGGEDRTSIAPGRLLFILAQLGVALLVIRQFRIESNAFLELAALAFAGFAVNAVLPLRLRLPFFGLLSLAAILLVMGLRTGAVLVALALVLMGLCHLPVSFKVRALLILVVAVALAALRAEWLPAPWSPAIWPILGSMFMFRLVVYLYDLRHDQAPTSFWRTFGYFLMLPNVCFPLFPVVDFKTFRRNHYADDAYKTYQVGVDWIVRGVTHLILYRVIYYYLTLAPSEVADVGDLVQFIVANFLLYLRVSGQFHVIVGLLYLFGFHLPETHHRYFLAGSFTDFWRRINIYWKDFMQKIFYFPVYFKLRRWNPMLALVLSTVLVFALTWLLHAYQWFWLRGSFLLTVPDVTFWGVLAVLVVINVIWETKRGRARTLNASRWTWNGSWRRALATAGTFCTIAVLWSLWTAESLTSWFALWPAALNGTNQINAVLSTLAVAAVAVGTTHGPKPEPAPTRVAWWRARRSTLSTLGMLTVLALLGIQEVYGRFGPTAATFLNSLRSGTLSRLDAAMLERGYYEDLVRVDRFNSQLWELYMKKPPRIGVQGLGIERFTGDLRQKELLPSLSVMTEHGPVTTNRWGMRDRDYELRPAPGSFRVAMLGASTVMGWGVGDGETFDALLENRLNQDDSGTRWEILNLAVPGYTPPQQLATLPKALEFAPSAMFYVAPGRELTVTTRYLAEVVRKDIEVPYEHLREVVREVGIDKSMDEATALRQLDPWKEEILSWMYQTIVAECRDRGVLPVYVFLPQVYAGAWQEETPDMLRLAGDAGFLVIDLGDVYAGQNVESIRLAEWDNHPNARGHELIAERLFEELSVRDDIFPVGPAQVQAANTKIQEVRR